MIAGRTHLETADPAAALARGQVLWRSVTPERPVALYGATLTSEARVLGAHQHPGHALSDAGRAAGQLLRRRTGGATVAVGAGVGYLAVGLSDRSAMMACPAGKLLNRNVRGTLAGLRRLKLPAHYFGRDFVSVASRPGAYIAWSEAADGRALIELFLGVEASFVPDATLQGYPEREEPMLRGKQAITLREAGFAGSVGEALAALRDGHAQCYGLELTPEALDDQELEEASALSPRLHVAARDDGLSWSDPLEEAIGFVAAGTRLDAAGRLQAVRIGGDFMQNEAAGAALLEALLGQEPGARIIGGAFDDAYASRPGLIEGVRSLGTLQQAVLDAVARHRALGAADDGTE